MRTDELHGADAGAEARIAAVVLAGGRASRCGGIPKGLLEVSPGLSILARTIAQIQSCGIKHAAISANDAGPYASLGIAVIPDLKPGLGPIGGIEAGLEHFRTDHDAVLFLPCDLPAITVLEVSRLILEFNTSGARLVYAEDHISGWHPLCCVVDTGLLDSIRELVADGHRKVSEMWRMLEGMAVRFEDPAAFFNVNTPADLARWKSCAKEKPPAQQAN